MAESLSDAAFTSPRSTMKTAVTENIEGVLNRYSDCAFKILNELSLKSITQAFQFECHCGKIVLQFCAFCEGSEVGVQ